ncbi:MAG: hypothetical protein U0133_20035 [Gemmatimonadales bacterium]
MESDATAPAPHAPLDPLVQAAVTTALSRELIHDARTLMKAGPGLYEMNLLNGACRQGFRYHPTLHIAGMTRARLMAGLRGMALEWDLVTQAQLNLKIGMEEKDPERGYNPRMVFGRYQGIYVLCTADAAVTVATPHGSWSATGRNQVDWPRDWGALGL